MRINVSVSTVNIWYLPDFLEWWLHRAPTSRPAIAPLNLNVVHNDRWFNIQNLPDPLKTSTPGPPRAGPAASRRRRCLPRGVELGSAASSTSWTPSRQTLAPGRELGSGHRIDARGAMPGTRSVLRDLSRASSPSPRSTAWGWTIGPRRRHREAARGWSRSSAGAAGARPRPDPAERGPARGSRAEPAPGHGASTGTGSRGEDDRRLRRSPVHDHGGGELDRTLQVGQPDRAVTVPGQAGDRTQPPAPSMDARTVPTSDDASRDHVAGGRTGHVAAPAVDAGDELLAGVAALREAHRRVDQPLAGLGRNRCLRELSSHGRHAVGDAGSASKPSASSSTCASGRQLDGPARSRVVTAARRRPGQPHGRPPASSMPRPSGHRLSRGQPPGRGAWCRSLRPPQPCRPPPSAEASVDVERDPRSCSAAATAGARHRPCFGRLQQLERDQPASPTASPRRCPGLSWPCR